MTGAPTFDEIFAVMAAASVGDAAARVTLPDEPQLDDVATRFAIALNLLLDDLQLRGAERQQFEEQLRQSQKMEAIGSLAGGVAHDFNNLLSVILGYSDMLLGAPLEDVASTREDLSVIKKAAERAADLTRQLLAFSRKQVLETKVVELNDTIAQVDRIIRRVIGEDIELRMIPGDRLWRVSVDPGQIEQVIVNLIVNARDAMPTGGTLTIETANVELDNTYAAEHVGVTPGPHVMLAVSDNGCGMGKETQARIFEPFFTTKEVGKGTGLGLSTVFGIVKQSRGNIWLYSEPGKGTTFKVYLPRTDDLPVTSTSEPSVELAGGGETILLVEDEPEVRTLLRRILSQHGYSVIEAQDPHDALDHCARFPATIHLLVTDVVMPAMSGPQLVERIGALRPETKVLYISGYTDGTIVHHGILDAGVAFLQKPITPHALLSKVRDVLHTHRRPPA
jgi:two-component system, cell cycle sensor histidine kinase and response regulator CckA